MFNIDQIYQLITDYRLLINLLLFFNLNIAQLNEELSKIQKMPVMFQAPLTTCLLDTIHYKHKIIEIPDEFIDLLLLGNNVAIDEYISHHNNVIYRLIAVFRRSNMVIANSKIQNIPYVIYLCISRLSNQKKFTEAALLLLQKRTYLLQNGHLSLSCKIFNEYEYLLKSLVYLKEFHIVKELLFLNIIDETHPKYISSLLTRSAAAIFFCEFDIALYFLRIIFQKAHSGKKKAQAAYLIGLIYLYLFKQKNDNKYKTEGNKWIDIATQQQLCLWSILAQKLKNKTIKIHHINELRPNQYKSVGDHLLEKSVRAFRLGNKLKAIQYIYSLKESDFASLSATFIQSLKYFLIQEDKVCAYMLGLMLFKKTGIIIKECFKFTKEINELIKENKIALWEGCLLMGIINIESKFYDHTYFSLENSALGITQIETKEILALSRQLRIPFRRKVFLSDKKMQLIFTKQLIHNHKRQIGNNLIFLLYYYNGGFKAYHRKNNLHCIDFSEPLFATAALINIPGFTRYYVINVLEFYFLCSIINENALILPNFHLIH